MTPGCNGADPPVTVTGSDLEGDIPQALLAVTAIFPPDMPATVTIESTFEVPVHPGGSIHV